MSFSISSLLAVGVSANTPSDETKKIRLLNGCCLCWIGFTVIFGTADFLFLENPLLNLVTHGSSAVVLLITMFLQFQQRYFGARLLYLTLSLINFSLFANVLEPNAFLEYFMILIPLMSLIFIDRLAINIFFLVAAYLLFYLPIYFLGHYENLEVNPLTSFILFLAIFIILNYFKTLNKKNEKLLEEQRNEAINDKEKIEYQRKKLEELNTFQSHFLVNLSHEIRTPLTLITGNNNRLNKVESRNEIFAVSEQIASNTDKIKQLVDNIIDLAKMTSDRLVLRLSPENLNEVCQKLIVSYASLFSQKKVRFRFVEEIENTQVIVNIDRTYFERAIGNLILNAYKYTEENGEVVLTISAQDTIAKVIVHDNGCGIPAGDLPYIFDSFYRASNAINRAGGSGVGLSFTKEVLNLHGAQISVNSIEQQETTFTVELPIANTLSVTEDHLESIATPDIGKIKILLVDDNADMRDYLKSVLSDHYVVEAENGKSGLELLARVKPDIIITDYMMPEMDGYEFISLAKEQGFDCPVIVLTARMDEEGKMEFLRLGIDDYLTKPFNEEELLIRMSHAVGNYRQKNTSEEDADEMNANEELALLKQRVLQNIDSATFGVSDFANELNMTERTLQRKIKSQTGLTANGFIREVKLQKAQELSLTGDFTTIKELALSLGFKNSSYFATLYEKRFGKKPFEDLSTQD